MRISDWSSDVCSSDLLFEQNHVQTASMHLTITLQGLPTIAGHAATHPPTVNSNAPMLVVLPPRQDLPEVPMSAQRLPAVALPEYAQPQVGRSEEHTSELQSLMRTSYPGFCLKKNIIFTSRSFLRERRPQQDEHSTQPQDPITQHIMNLSTPAG